MQSPSAQRGAAAPGRAAAAPYRVPLCAAFHRQVWDVKKVGAVTLADTSAGCKWPKPAADTACTVKVTGWTARVNGQVKAQTATYTVTIYDPAKP